VASIRRKGKNVALVTMRGTSVNPRPQLSKCGACLWREKDISGAYFPVRGAFGVCVVCVKLCRRSILLAGLSCSGEIKVAVILFEVNGRSKPARLVFLMNRAPLIMTHC